MGKLFDVNGNEINQPQEEETVSNEPKQLSDVESTPSNELDTIADTGIKLNNQYKALVSKNIETALKRVQLMGAQLNQETAYQIIGMITEASMDVIIFKLLALLEIDNIQQILSQSDMDKIIGAINVQMTPDLNSQQKHN